MASASRALRFARLPAPLLRGGGAASSRSLRPIAAAAGSLLPSAPQPFSPAHARFLATQAATSSLRDSSPTWNNRPPRETLLLDGCDFEHWLVVMEPPPGNPSDPEIPREELIDGYIKTLAKVVGSEQEARQKIYSVSTRHYFAFGALVPEELSYKLKDLPNVRWVLADSYLDAKNKDYGGEPFINGEAVPYDPKYHEEWVRNNARVRPNDWPRNYDRSRNFEKIREKLNFQYTNAPLVQVFNIRRPQQLPPHDAPPMHHAQSNMPPPTPPNVSAPPDYQTHAPNPQAGYPPSSGQNFQQGGAPGYHGGAPNPQAGYPPSSGQNFQQGGAPGYHGGAPGYQGVNQGYQGSHGGPDLAYQSNPSYHSTGGPPYEGREAPGRNHQ